jgi:sulfite reductase (ferredoxin)
MFYETPPTLVEEIDQFDSHVQSYLAGQIDAESLKAKRVPFGCYEQRENGTYMLRVRCPGGAITPRQLRMIAAVSKAHGRDTIHVTTRQEFQIHDLRLKDVVPAIRHLLTVGLSTRGGGGNTVRNIILSSDAGISADEVFDPSPFVFALTSRLIGEPDSWALPRKFKIAFSNSGKDSVAAQFNDLGFIATIRCGAPGFRVYVAGGMGAKPEVGHLLHEFISLGDVYFVAEAVKRLFAKHGNRKDKNAARLRFLWSEKGEDGIRQLYDEELQLLRRESVAPLKLRQSATPSLPIRLQPVEDHSSGFQLWRHRYVTSQSQPGLCSILIPVFLGDLNCDDALALALFLEAFGDDSLRATSGQNLRLRNIPEGYLGNIYGLVKDTSELTSAPALVGNTIACAGAGTCRLGICLSKGAARAVQIKLVGSSLDLDRIADFKVHLSGCPNTCGQHMIADLGFYGKVGRIGDQILPAYGVVAGAIVGDANKSRFGRNLGQIGARDLPSFVEDVLRIWIQNEHRFGSFAAYIDCEGEKDIRAICERYRPRSDSKVAPRYFVDWGASRPFSLDGRCEGECSAGPAN